MIKEVLSQLTSRQSQFAAQQEKQEERFAAQQKQIAERFAKSQNRITDLQQNQIADQKSHIDELGNSI